MLGVTFPVVMAVYIYEARTAKVPLLFIDVFERVF